MTLKIMRTLSLSLRLITEAYNIDFDYDDGGRMMVDDSDVDIIMDIIDDLGVKASIV